MSQYLTFQLENEHYAIDITNVIEIIGIQKITRMPQQPSYMNGVINLRDRIIPTIDVRARFLKDRIEYDERTCIIVTKVEDTVMGLIVDRVDEVMTIPEQNISSPPSVYENENGRFISGIAKSNQNIIMLVSSEMILSGDEIRETELLLNKACS